MAKTILQGLLGAPHAEARNTARDALVQIESLTDLLAPAHVTPSVVIDEALAMALKLCGHGELSHPRDETTESLFREAADHIRCIKVPDAPTAGA